MSDAGLPSTWVQDNFSISKKNVLRGLHYQVTQPQGKLVRVTHGAVLDIAVDLRRSSPRSENMRRLNWTARAAECCGFLPALAMGFWS